MLPRAEQVDEFDIDHRDILVLEHLQNLFRSHLTRFPPCRTSGAAYPCIQIDLSRTLTRRNLPVAVTPCVGHLLAAAGQSPLSQMPNRPWYRADVPLMPAVWQMMPL